MIRMLAKPASCLSMCLSFLVLCTLSSAFAEHRPPALTTLLYSTRAQETLAVLQTGPDRFRLAYCHNVATKPSYEMRRHLDSSQLSTMTLNGQKVCELLTQTDWTQSQVSQFADFLISKFDTRLRAADYWRFISLNVGAVGFYVAVNHLIEYLSWKMKISSTAYQMISIQRWNLGPIAIADKAFYAATGVLWGVGFTYLFVYFLNRGKSIESILRALNEPQNPSVQMIDVYRGTWNEFMRTFKGALAEFEKTIPTN